MYPKKIVVATRPSKLSLVQTEIAISWIRKFYPDVEFEIRTFKSTGDKIQDKALYEIGVKGIFEKEINLAVLRGEADIAVHSLKDLPAEIHPDIVLACFPPRDSPFDVLVTPRGVRPDIRSLPSGARIGTSSVRRRAFLMRIRRDLDIRVIRGNVDTRIRKLLSGQYDAILLAECGITRLAQAGEQFDIEYMRLPPDDMPPAPGQGIIAVAARKDDTELVRMLREISHPETTVEALCERAFLKYVGGGCHVPLGCLATCSQDKVRIFAAVALPDGSESVAVLVEGSREWPEEVGKQCAEELRKRGVAIFERLTKT